MRLIDVDKVIQEHGDDITNWDKPCAVFISSLEAAPTVDTVEVAHAKWAYRTVMRPEAPDVGGYWEDVETYCTACNDVDYHDLYSPYCPHCGAKMDLED